MTQSTARLRSSAIALAASIVVSAGLTAGTIQTAHAISSPSSFRAVVVATQGVGLAWTSTGEDAYRVRFSTSSNMSSNADTWDVLGNYLEWTHLDANPTNSSSRLKPGASYYFQVKAIDSDTKADLSSYSKVLKVTLPKTGQPELRPTKISATAAGSDEMYVSWRSRGPGAKYILRYTTDRSKSVLKWTKAPKTFDTPGAVIKGLDQGKRYYFRARVVDNSGKARSDYSANSTSFAGTTPSTTDSPRISLVSYNVRKASGTPTWATRRKPVATNILSQTPDVVALQEATPLTYDGRKQYDDIVHLLGDNYSLVTRAGSSGSKMVYNKTTMAVVDTGTQELSTYGDAERYAVWAILRDKRSDAEFFVINTHLEPGDQIAKYNEWRIKQAEEILDLIDEHADDLPVVIAGDMNSSRNASPNNGQYEVFTGAGYIDPLDNATMSWKSGAEAITEHLLDVEYNSSNNFATTARRTPYPVGTNIDYVYTSPGIRVGTFRTKVSLDTAGKFVGTIPSDHNLLALNLHLPVTPDGS